MTGTNQIQVEPTKSETDSHAALPMLCRGVRGATTVAANTSEDILEATHELLSVVIELNDLDPQHVASVIFTTTPDLDAVFPAIAARDLGWNDVPLLCSHEMSVPASLQKAVRVLIHVNTTRPPSEIRHVYLKGAGVLRPEWSFSDERLAEILATIETGTHS